MTFRFRKVFWNSHRLAKWIFRVANWVRTPFQVSYGISPGSFGFANFFACPTKFSQSVRIGFRKVAKFSQGA